MRESVAIALILNMFLHGSALACTTLLVTKGASEDGSVMVGHSDDSELFDQRLVSCKGFHGLAAIH